jgi:hypothetical protein
MHSTANPEERGVLSSVALRLALLGKPIRSEAFCPPVDPSRQGAKRFMGGGTSVLAAGAR